MWALALFTYMYELAKQHCESLCMCAVFLFQCLVGICLEIAKQGDRMVTLREFRLEDAQASGNAFYHAFLTENVATGIPPDLDMPSVEAGVSIVKHMACDPAVMGVSVLDDSSGEILGGGFIHLGKTVWAIGPVYVRPDTQCKGIGKMVMLALLEKAEAAHVPSVRLTQSAPNQRSFSLYSSLGFVPVECITRLYGSVDSSQAEAAAAAVGISTAGIETRWMEEGDIEACSALFTEAGLGYSREDDITASLHERPKNARVALKENKIVGYTTGLDVFGHTIAKDEGACVKLCMAAADGPQSNFFLPSRLYPRLLRWALGTKLRVARHSWYMVKGEYQGPADSFQWFPNVLH